MGVPRTNSSQSNVGLEPPMLDPNAHHHDSSAYLKKISAFNYP